MSRGPSDVFSLGATLHYAVVGEGLYGPLPDEHTCGSCPTIWSCSG